MRKIILVWTTVAMASAIPPLAQAQSRKFTDDTASPRGRSSVKDIDDSDDEEFQAKLDFERIADEEDAALVRPKAGKKSGRTLLTSAEDPLPPLPDYDPAMPRSSQEYESVYTPTCDDCPEFWEHRCAVWAEFLFWRPRGADVVYASTVDGTLATSVPIGGRSIADYGYDPGFRVGAAWALNNSSSITANYTWFRATNDDHVGLPGGGGSFLAAETVHPNTVNVAADSLAASARYDLSLQSIDVNYKGLIFGDECLAVNYIAGVKYAHLDQQFNGLYSILGTTTVDTNVDFSGTGPRFGFDAERLTGKKGFLVYSRGTVNFLVGSTSATFLQTNAFTGIQAKTGLHDSRIVTVPELEFGGGWQSCDGCFRVTAGYYLAAWFNMMTTPEYLSTIWTTQNTFEDQIKTLTLDGLTLRAEYRW